MKLVSISALALAALSLTACKTSESATMSAPPPASAHGASAMTAASGQAAAMANLEGRSNTPTSGTATFTKGEGNQVALRLQVTNAKPGTHAAHIHEKGDCSAPDASSAGGHWNPTGEHHGQWGHDGHHLGDLGNVEVGPDGTGTLTLTSDKWTLGDGGPNDIVGKAVVVHANVDDFTSQPAGNAGGRVACGVIQATGR